MGAVATKYIVALIYEIVTLSEVEGWLDSALLANAEIESRVKVALRAIQIASSVALGLTQQVPANLETLQQAIASQPDSFKVSWTFEGTKHFISIEPKLARYREWLLQFFAAIETEEGREVMLATLREVRASFAGANGKRKWSKAIAPCFCKANRLNCKVNTTG